MIEYGGDLEAFAKHAKRSTVQADDVKLLVRRNKGLVSHIQCDPFVKVHCTSNGLTLHVCMGSCHLEVTIPVSLTNVVPHQSPS